jgi:hypothetical protein
MTNDSGSNNNDHRPTNLVEFECQETKHMFGLDKFPDVPTEKLLISLKDMIKSIEAPSNSRQTDIECMALQYWAEMCIELLGMRVLSIIALINECLTSKYSSNSRIIDSSYYFNIKLVIGGLQLLVGLI